MKLCKICGMLLEIEETYHKKCLKKLFGVDYVPMINFSLPEITLEAQHTAGKLSISGVQPKLSVRLNTKNQEIEVTPDKGEYILKPQTQVYAHLPENENLCMTIAELVGINVPPHGLFELKDGTKAYIIKRYDRNKSKKIHQENFYQILDKRDKYKGSLEEIGLKLKEISDVPGLDIQLFYERVLFNFLIGNGDAHSKNFSIIYAGDDKVRLAPAYDIICSKLVIPDEEDLALTLNGKKNKLMFKDFQELSKYLNLPDNKIKNRFINEKSIFISQIQNSNLTADEKLKLKGIIEDRFNRIKQI